MSIETSEYENAQFDQANDFIFDASANQFIYFNQHSRNASETSEKQVISQENNSQGHKNAYKQTLQVPDEYRKRDLADKQNEQKDITSSSEPVNQNNKKQMNQQGAYLNTLRFSKLKSSASGVSISPSGLTATCKASQSTHYALCGTVFPHNSTYYFELVFPNGCEGIDFGLIQTPANLNNPQLLKTHLVTYKYKTLKTVGFKVDTKDWTIKVWLNGEFQKLKSKRIPKGDYAFCLKMSMRGISCILNPFAEDPEKSSTLYKRNAALISKEDLVNENNKKVTAENMTLLLEELIKLIKEENKSEDSEQINKEKDEQNKNTSKEQNEVNYILGNKNLIVMKEDKMKLIRKNQQGIYPLHYSHFINKPVHLKDVVYVSFYLSEIQALLDNASLFSSLPASISSTFIQLLIDAINVCKSSQSSLSSSSSVTLRTTFVQIKTIVDSIIEVISGHIASIYEFIYPPTIHILPEEKKAQFSSNVVLNSNEQVYLNDGLPFFNDDEEEEIGNQQTETNAQKNVQVVSEETASAPNNNINAGSQQVAQAAALPKKMSKDENDLQRMNSKDPEEQLKEISKNWDIHYLHQILYIALRIDEQLFGMTLHEDASNEIKQAFNTGVSRIFTAFGRLISFYNYSSTSFSFESLAEAGLINIHDLQSELRHFLDYYTPLQIQKKNLQQDLHLQISSQTTDNYLINGGQNLNIGLDVTVNSIPYSTHKSLKESNEQNQIKFIKPYRQYVSNYITSIDSQGTINIWNTELTLQRVAINDFKSEFEYPKECNIDSDLRKNEEEQNNKINEASINQAFQSSLYKILENSISSQCKYAKKPKPVEKSITANSEILEKLLNLGFSVNVAKKACIEVKNESVDKALDVALRIQKEELSENEMMDQKNQLFGEGDDEIHVNSIKPFWSCEICTYQNVGTFTKCDMCFYPAPESAYYTEQEVSEIMQEKMLQKQLEEERILKEITLKEEEERRIKIESQQLEEKRLKQIEENKRKMTNFLEGSEVQSGFLLNLQKKSLSQLIIGVGFNNNKSDNVSHKSLLRIRKFAVNPTVLQQFYSLTQKGIVCNLTGQYIQENNISSFENLLLQNENNRYIFESLAPLAAENPELFSLLAVQEANIIFEEDTIIDSNWRLISTSIDSETYELVVLTQSPNKSFQLHQYKLRIDLNDPYNLQKKEIETEFLKKIRISGPNTANEQSYLLCPDNSSIALIISQQKLISIPISIGGNQQNETIEIKELRGNAVNVRFISCDQILILDDASRITLVKVKQNQIAVKQSQLDLQQNEIASTDFENLTNFNEDQIAFLSEQLSFNYLGCLSRRQTQNSCIYDCQSDLNSKHTFLLRNDSTSQCFEFEFKLGQSLQSLCLDFYLRSSTNNELLPLQNSKNKKTELAEFFSFDNWEPQNQQKSGQNGNTAVNNSLEKQNKYLPTMISRCTGTPYSQKHQASAILFPNQSCFQSFDTPCYFLLKHLQNSYMIIDSITIDSYNHPIEGGYPIGTVLVFTADHPSVLERASHIFSSMTSQEYNAWKQKNSGRQLETWEPVACVSFSDSETTKTVHVDFKRCSKYVMIMPTQLRSKFQHLAGNQCISYQFVGIQGFAIDKLSNLENGLILKDGSTSTDVQQIKDYIEQNLIIEVQNESGWHKLNSQNQNIILNAFSRYNLISDYRLNDNAEKNINKIPDVFASLSNLSHLSLSFLQEELLASSKIYKIRVTLNTSQINNSNFINSFSFASKGRPLQNGNESLQRNMLLNINKFDQINGKILSQLISLSSSSYNPETRNLIEAASEYLIKLMSVSHNSLQNDDIINLIYKKFDFERFISSNILQNPTRKFTYQYNLLKNFNNCPGFPQKLLNSCLNLLPAITTKQIPVTESGLNIFLSLLRWCQPTDSSKIFISLLNSLHTISKKVQEKKDPFYNILTSRYDINSVCFEERLFSDQFVSKECKQIQNRNFIEERSYLECKLMRSEDLYIDKIYIDLQKQYNLSSISLAFAKNSIQSPNFRVIITAYNHKSADLYDSQLLFDQSYSSETFVQLSNYSHENSSLKQFQHHSELSTLSLIDSLSANAISTRYLSIQINYSLRPFVGTSKEMSDLPNTQIIPQISGEVVSCVELLTNDQPIPFCFPKDFLQQSKLRKGDYKNIQQQNSNVESTIQSNTDSAGVQKSNGQAPRKESLGINSNSPTYLEDMQKKLKQLLQNEETHREVVIKYVVEIEEYLRQQYQKENNKALDIQAISIPSNNQCNLSYLYTLAFSFSQFLRKMNETQISEEENRKNNNWISSATQNGKSGVFHDVFERFVVFDNSMLSQEILTLLDEVLIDNLSEKEWLQFVFTILKKYLMQPQSNTLPMNQLFSQTNLIKALDRISIPLGEVLAFLAIQLNIPIENVILETQEKDISYSYLAPTLALLYNGFKNIPKININQRAQKNKESTNIQNSNPNKLAQVLDPISLKLTKSVSRELERINNQKLSDSSSGITGTKQNEGQSVVEPGKDVNKEKSEDEEDIFIVLPPTGVKRSVSHPLKNETQKRSLQSETQILSSIEEQDDIVRLDYDESFTVAFQVCVWIVEHRNKFEDQDEFVQLMKLCFNLLELISSLSSMNGIKKCLLTNSFNNNAFFKLYFYVLSSDQKEISALLSHLIRLLSNPPSFNSIDWTSLNKEEVSVLLNEKQSLEEIQLILVYQLEQILQWMLEYSMYPSSSKYNLYAITLGRQINSEEWSSHLQFTMQLLLEVNKTLQEEFKRKSFLEAAAINLRKTSNLQSQRKMQSLERQQSRGKKQSCSISDETQINVISSSKDENGSNNNNDDCEGDEEIAEIPQKSFMATSHDPSSSVGTQISQQQQYMNNMELTPVGISRSLSVPINQQQKLTQYTKQQMIDFVDKSVQERQCSLSIRTAVTLIDLIEASSNTEGNSNVLSFIDNTSIWTLLFKFIEQLKVKQILSSKIFQRLANLFFNYEFLTSKTLQQMLLSKSYDFLMLTQNLFNKFSSNTSLDNLPAHLNNLNSPNQSTNQESAIKDQKKFCSLLLNMIFEQLIPGLTTESTQASSLTEKRVFVQDIPQQISSVIALKTGILQYNSIHYFIINGWLDILLTKCTPKPESYYTQSNNEISYCKLSPLSAASLLVNISQYLLVHCNFGGLRGIEISDYSILIKLQIMSVLIQIFLRSEISPTTPNNKSASPTQQNQCLKELFSSSDSTIKERITTSISNLIKWYIFNKSKEAKNSPVTVSLSQISSQVIKIFEAIAEYSEISKIFLRELINVCKNLDRVMKSQFKEDEINILMAQQFTDNASDLLEIMFDLLVCNDEVASYVAFNVDGFQFLLEKMGLEKAQKSKKEVAKMIDYSDNKTNKSSSIRKTSKYEIASYIDQSILEPKSNQIQQSFALNNLLQNYEIGYSSKNKTSSNAQLNGVTKDTIPTIPSSGITSTLLHKIIPEEQCNKAKLIKIPGQTWTNNPTNWSENKGGQLNTNLIWTQMNGKQHSECYLTLELENKIQLSSIKIGFNFYWADYEDKVLGVPSNILVEYTDDLSHPFKPLSHLPIIQDQGYESFKVKVAAKNFERLREDGNGEIERLLKLDSIQEVKYLRFRMTRPVLNFIENGSVLQNKLFENIAISISFISVMGYNLSLLSSTQIHEKIISVQELSSIKLIGKLCNQSFHQTLNLIANNDQILDKIKRHFEVMSTLLINHEQFLAPVFLAIAGNNQEMGDWILQNFLDLNKGISHAKMVSEIVCSQLSHTHKRVQKVHNFVLNTAIKEILSLHEVAANQFQATFKFLALLPFAETWTTSVHISALDFTTHTQQSLIKGEDAQNYQLLCLPVTQETIDNIIQLYKIFYGTSKYKLIIKILVNALNLPSPYVLSADISLEEERKLRENLLLNTLSQLWNLSKTDSKYYELIAPLILSNKCCVDWLLQEDQKKLLQILGQLLNLIKQNSSTSQNMLLDYLNFLNAITSNTTIQTAICSQKMHINFYNCLKDHDKNSIKFIKSFQNPQMISIIVDILKNIALSSPEQAKIFAKVLSDDIKQLTTKRDMVFVTNLLVPLLNSEKSVSVAFHPFDAFSNKWLAEGKKILEYKRDIKSNAAQQENLNKQAAGPQAKQLTNIKPPLPPMKKDLNKGSNVCWDYLTQSLTTKLLWNDKQRQALNKNLEIFSKKTNLYTQLSQPAKSSEDNSKVDQPKKQLYYQWQLALVQDKDSDPAMLDQVKENVLKHGPFLILIEGINQEQRCLSGVFSSQSMESNKIETESGEAQIIPRAEDNFIFYYEETFQMHFDVPPDSTKQLGSLMLVDKTGVGLQFQYLDNERIFISYQQQTPSVVDINLQEMVPIDIDTKNFPKDVPVEFELTKVEYWILKPQELPSNLSLLSSNSSKNANSSSLLSNLHNNLLFSSHNLSASSIANYYRAVPVYQIPESLDFEKILSMVNVSGYWLNEQGKQQLTFKLRNNNEITINSKTKLSELLENGISNDGVIDLEFDALNLYENCTEIQNSSLNPITNRIDYLPIMPIFDMFSEEGGIQQIIEVIQASLKSWKNTERASKWEVYMKELKNFSKLPNYFGLFMKNKDCIELLFELLAGLPDEIPSFSDDKSKKAPGTNTPTIPPTTTTTTTTTSTTIPAKDKQNAAGAKKWDDEEQKAVSYSYQVLKDTFKLGQDNSVRQVALENKLIEAILDKITLISKEVKRKFVPESSQEEETNEIEETQVLTKQASEDDGKKKIVQKKGIGYGSDNTGQNQKWNTNDYIESKKARSESLRNFIAVFEAFLDFKNWEPPHLLVEQIMESSLLPLIESSLRSGSLLEMSKEKELVFTYLSLLKVMTKNSCLVPCLLPLDQRYLPKQTESILFLIGQLRDTAKIFLNCMSAKTDNTVSQQQIEETANSKKLAEEIVLTYEMITEACKHYEQEHEEEGDLHNQQEAINQILELPLPQKYKILLQDLRFDYTSFKNDQGKYKHHYSSSITTQYSPPQAKMVRLAQELADLSTALPIDHTNSIFVRCDSDRVDVMKCMVMGAKGTPYAHGAFIFDVYFSDEYPNQPPKCNLETTGSGKVRFNPNLYACGKVCLSLLGTWRGNASENWDPKISTLLQILVSLQAIIMSEEVYFNEPGFEGEAGTEEGEKKNEAYSNIVRYCNIKYAMIDQIKNPPEGFQSIIQRHFYLKKAEILEECQKWIKYADVRQASYVGLVNDHNSSWCSEFKSKYAQMLREAVTELEQVLNTIPAPNAADTKHKIKGLKKKQPKKDTKKLQFDITQGVAKIEDIDVKYDDDNDDKKQEGKETDFIDINDEKVKDRWSRYIGAMGIDAVAKQSKCSVFLSGLGSLGVEISKNLVMSGIKRLTIHDSKQTTYNDLSGQFYLGEEDIGKNRAESSLRKIRQLNHYVKVDTVLLDKELPDTEDGLKEQLSLQDYNIVVLTDVISIKKQITINNFCRSRGIKFISADVYGPWCRLFNDFGDQFEVADKNGEDPQEVMIKSITNAEKGVVTLLTGAKHPYEDGEHIILSEVQGMEVLPEDGMEKGKEMMMTMDNGEQPSQKSINNTIHKIRVINSNSFEIGDTRGFSKYIRNGVAKNIKTPVNIQFKSLQSVWDIKKLDDIPFDPNLVIHDFEKFDNPRIVFLAFKVLEEFQSKHSGKMPQCWNSDDAKEFLALSEPLISVYYEVASQQPKNLREVLLRFALTVNSNLGPFAAFLGGFVTQEIVKAMTNKYIPTSQLFFSDCMEVIPESSELNVDNYQQYIEKNYQQLFAPQKNRNDGVRFAIGNNLLSNIHYCNLFMVGCGAIGCELLKNFAMINLATGYDTKTGKKGILTITDPDHIEVSNLNRQFLFREKHLRKPKSQTAAATIIQMNPLLKDHILARLDKVHDGTINIFSDKFFSTLTVIANALDNVQARRYVDSRCVTNKKPLLESGTLGPKGHVQVVLPYQTESYGSQQDPQEEGEIPHCTLKMFPEETLHCVEWARDKFGKLFTLRPKSVIKILEDPSYDPQGGQELKEFKEAVKLLEKRPKNFSECITYAVKKFYKYFRNDIKQLMYTYPIDSKTKDGEPFWKLPKRPPTDISFDPNNQLHRDFVTALAVLRAKIFQIEYPKTFRTESEKQKIAVEASLVKIEEFKPSEDKAQAISTQVNKDKPNKSENNGDEEIEAQNEESKIGDEATEKINLFKRLNEFKKDIPQEYFNPNTEKHFLQAEEFEKDEDDNGHIDLIYSMANCRSTTYKLAPMDWIQVKIKAGRIVPALATTTATVAGLQTIELIKILKNEKLSNMKNAFLNLAVPLIQLTEPQKAEKIKIHEELEVTLWDRWNVELGQNVTLKQIFNHFLTQYKLNVCDIMSGSKLIYSSTVMDMPGKENEKESQLNAQLIDLIEVDDDYLDFIFTFSDMKGEKVKQTPLVRVLFK